MRIAIVLFFGLLFCINGLGQSIDTSGSTTFCEGGNVVLTVNPVVGITGYQWIRGSNDTLSEITSSYTATSTGSYRVRLKRESLADTIIGPAIVTVNPKPNVSVNSPAICVGQPAILTATGATTYTWTPVTGLNPATGPTVTATVTTTTTYTVTGTLSATNCSNTAVSTVTVNPNPIADFTFSTNACSGTNVGFNSTVTSGTPVYTYHWDFGDGGTSTMANPLHTFTSLGCATHDFTIKLTVTDSKGCENTITKVATVLQAPNVQITDLQTPGTPFSNCSNDPSVTNPNYTITVGNISPDLTCISAYSIDWGDGLIENNVTFPLNHTYTKLGAFNLKVGAIGTNGCSNTKTYTVANQKNPDIGIGTFGLTEGCANLPVNIVLSGWATNSPGTTYLLQYGDGTFTSYTHPINPQYTNDTIIHEYSTTSCPNSPVYNITITAANACRTKSFIGGDIVIKSKPQSDFTINTPTSCVGQSVCFTNSTKSGYDVNCNTFGATMWNFGDPSSGSDNSSTDPSPCHIYSLPGIYTINLTTTNVCGPSTISKIVCVTRPPAPAFTLSNTTGCIPLTTNAINTTELFGSCETPTYSWKVTYTSAFCGTDSSWSFANGTSASSTNPSFIFKSPGTYTITLSVTNTCGTFDTSLMVNVKKPPVVAITPLASSCGISSIMPVAVIDACTNNDLAYTWTFEGGSPGISNTANPGSVTFTTAGSHLISLSVTNECGTTTNTAILQIDTVSVANAGAAQNICGSIVTMAANIPTIGTGKWTIISGPNTPVITNFSSPTTTITGLITGTYVFRWTITNQTCTSNSDVTITIFPRASPAIAGPDQSLCLATSANLGATMPVNGTGFWTQVNGANTASITMPSSASTPVTGLITGTYTFRWTVNFSNCPPNADDVQVVVYDNPSIASAGTDQTICAATTALAGNTPATGNGTWNQVGNLPNIAAIDNTASPFANISGLIPGSYKFTWTITNGPCTSAQDTVEINVTEVATVANAGADINICTGAIINLTGNLASVGTGVWTIVNGPAGAVITQPALPNTSITGLVPGIYTFRWTITNGNCPPGSDDVQVTVYDNPSVADAGTDQTICAATASLAANIPIIGNGTWSQIGNLPNSANINDPASPSTALTGLIAGTYKFKWTVSNGPCIGTQDTVEINVTEVATTANAGADVRVCAVSTINLAGNTPIAGAGMWLIVSGPPGAVITNTSLPNTGVTNLVPGTYILRWTIANGNCPPSTDDVQVVVDENVSTAVAGHSQNICGTTATMAANTPAIGTGRWSYVSGSAGYQINTPGSPETGISGLLPGTYIFRWTITNGSCSSNSDVTIIISPGASIADAGTDQELCLAASTTLLGNNPSIGSGVWSYVNGPAGSVIVTPNAPSTSITGLVPGTYSFRYSISYSNCTVNTDVVQVIVYDNPSTSNAGSNQTICAAATSFEANLPSIGNGTWSQVSGPNTALINNPASPVSVVSSLVPGIYKFSWTIRNGPCMPTQDTVEINVSAIATTANTGADLTFCALQNINLLANAPLVGIGIWTNVNGPNLPLISTPGNNSTTVSGLIPGTYIFRWTITNGVCPPSTDDVNVIILDSLQNNVTAAITTICAGQSIDINGALPLGGNGTYNYQWQQSADGNTWEDVNGENSQNFSGILNSTTYLRRKVTSLPCENISNVIKITVQPGILNNAISASDSICINTPASIINGSAPTGGDGTYSYQWQNSINGSAWNDIPGAINGNYDPGVLIQTTQYRRLVSTSLCSGPQSSISNVVIFNINQNSKAEFIGSPAISCTPFSLSPVITVNTHADRNLLYNWFADGTSLGSNTTGTFPGYSINNPGDTVIIKLVTTSQFGCKPDSTEQPFITVRTAVAAFLKDTPAGCGPLSVTFNNTSNIIDNNIQFFWNFGNGITSSLEQPGIITFLQSPFFQDTTYQISLKAYNGCDTTIWRDSVKIRSNPKVRFGVDTTSGCSPFTVHLTNNSLGGPNTYYWDFGNGHKDTTFATGPRNYTYNIGNVVDTFPIRLIAVNECASDTQTINIRVAPNAIMPQITINASELFGCTPHIVAFNNATIGATSFTWDYGDNTVHEVTSNGQSIVTHKFNDPGIFNIAIRMTNGCSDTTAYRQVTVFAKPKANFVTTTPAYCLNDTIRVYNSSSNASNYSWFWGDGQSSTGLNPIHIYTSAGNYTILLRAEKTNGSGIICLDTLVQNVTVLVKPDARVQSNITSINCSPFTLNATAPGIVNESVTWYISDTAVSAVDIVRSGISMQYIFRKAGTFSVKMLAVNASGCKDSTIKTFIVRGTPDAAFTPLNVAVCKTDTTVSYVNATTFNDNGPLTYRWLTDGIQQSTDGNFTYRYTAPLNTVLPKTFVTQLIATNTAGCSDTATGMLQLKPLARAQFSIHNPTDCVPFTLSITNASQYGTAYKWLLNGVLTDTGANPAIAITKALTQYKISLIADNIYGCRPDTFSVTFVSRIKPVAKFELNDTLGCTGVLNVVTANQSSNANFYQWNWGDNSANSSFNSPTHLYTIPGRYLISLVASDGVCKDTSEILVTVATKPAVDFSADDTLTCDTARIKFTNLTRNADSYLWSFSDGISSTAVNPVKNFAPGPLHYTVKLVALNVSGCKDSLIKSNLIFAEVPPAVDFLISPSPVITVPDYTFTFNNLTLNNDKYTYQWSLGDGAFAHTRDVTHQYPDTGSYPVRLIALDTSTGCPDTTVKIAVINGYPGFLYVPNAFYPNSLRNEFKTFKPLGKGLADYRLQIFDGWGKLLFETSALDAAGSPAVGWDGTDKGKPVPQDAYAWRIVAHFKSGKLWDGMSYGSRAGKKPGNTFGTLTLFR